VSGLLETNMLALAAKGERVFLLKPGGKEPYERTRGFLDATTDAEQIRAWCGIPGAENSNIGLRPAPDVLVVDIDPRADGMNTALALEAQHGALPDTRTVATGGDGLHVYLRVPPGLSWPKQLGPGVDLKSESGYLVAPPSVHASGKRYRWLKELPIAEAPAWLVALGRSKNETTTVTVIDEDEADSLPEETIAGVVAQLTPHFVEGRKHALSFAAGGWLRQRGWNQTDITRVVEALPSKNPRARAKDALDGYRAANDHGWHTIRQLVGEEAAAALDVATPNPRRDGERAAAASLVEGMAASAVVPQPAVELAVLPVASGSGLRVRLERVRDQGPPHPTGVPPLDRALRGGLRAEKIIVVGGAPGAGKTSLARQIADYMCRHGVAIAWLAADEEPTAIDARRMQAIGIPRHVAEQPDAFTIADALEKLEPLPFVIYDAADGWTVERAFADIAARYPDLPRLVVCDSLQTVRTERSISLDSIRAKIDDVIATAKTLSRAPATRAMVVLTSELARGSYRSESGAEAINDLAAFKESGGIEYGAHTLLVLRSVKGDGQFVEVAMPKNRLGPKIDFLLRLDPETTDMTESFDDPRTAAANAAAEAAIPDVQRALQEASWPGLSGRAVEQLAGRKAEAVRAALKIMAQRGLATMTQGKGNALCWMPASPGAGRPANDCPPPRMRRDEPSLAASQQELASRLIEERQASGK